MNIFYNCFNSFLFRYWGDGGDGTGKNRLGFVLMQVRDKIRKYKAESK